MTPGIFLYIAVTLAACCLGISLFIDVCRHMHNKSKQDGAKTSELLKPSQSADTILMTSSYTITVSVKLLSDLALRHKHFGLDAPSSAVVHSHKLGLELHKHPDFPTLNTYAQVTYAPNKEKD